MTLDDVREHHRIFIAAFVTSLIVFAYSLTNFALHIDDEFLLVPGAYGGDVALGRWGTALLHSTVLPQAFVPFFTPAVSLGIWAISAVVASLALDITRSTRYLFVTLYTAFPAFAYQLEFPFQSDCVALGVVCATLSYRFVTEAMIYRKGRFIKLSASVAFLTFGVSFYQSILFVPSTIALVACLSRVAMGRSTARETAVALWSTFVLMLVSYGACSVIGIIVQRQTGIPHAAWMQYMVGWGRIPWREALPDAASAFGRTALGGTFYGNGIYATCWVAACVVLVRTIMQGGSLYRGLLTAALLLTSLLSPFIGILVLGVDQAPRTYLAEAVAFAGIWAIAIEQLRERFVPISAVVATTILYGCYHVSNLFFSDTMAYEADTMLGSRIVDALYRTNAGFDERNVPVLFSGATSPTMIWRHDDFGVFGSSFFAWDGGNPSRIVAFLKAAGIASLRIPDAVQTAASTAEVAAMPEWPNPHSVRSSHGVMIVKLGK